MENKEINDVTKTLTQINDNLTVIAGQLVLGSIDPSIAEFQVKSINILLSEVVDKLNKLGINTSNNSSFNNLLTTANRNILSTRNFAQQLKQNNVVDNSQIELET